MSAADNRPNRRRALRHVMGIGVSLGCLALVLRRTDLASVRGAMTQLDWRWLAVGLASLSIDYAIRVHRWAVMLRAGGAHVRGTACAAPFVGSIALNNLVPFRAGDVVRAFVFPAAIGVRRVTATASIVLERILDLVALLIALGLGLALGTGLELPGALGRAAVFLGILGGVAVGSLVLFSRAVARALAKLADAAEERSRPRVAAALRIAMGLVEGLGAMSRPAVVVVLFLLSVVVWVGEAGLFLALLAGFGIAGGPAAALVVMAVATLSTLVPSSPGYVGPFHLAAFSAVTMLGATSAQAASFAFLAHLALWLPTTLAGVVAIVSNQQLFRAARRAPSLENP